MRLDLLLQSAGGRIFGDISGVDVRDIQIDSREVQAGTLFVARKGWYDDGHTYIDAALSNGAVAVAVSREETVPDDPAVPFVLVEDEDVFLSDIAVRFFGNPTAELDVIGVTGTNGKTSVAFFTSQLLDALHVPHALISTVHYRVGDEVLPAPNTTPDSLVIQRIARRAVDTGAQVLVMEVSSHGIALDRIRGTQFDAVGFTNLSEEHQDFHETYEDYRDTKRRLFTDIIEQSRAATTAVICVDDDEGLSLYGLSNATETMAVASSDRHDADLRVTQTERERIWKFSTSSAELMSRVRLIGSFNRANLGVALGLVHATTRSEWHELFRLSSRVVGAPGRLQRAYAPAVGEPEVFVDYAHSPDAVRSVLEAVLDSAPGQRLVTVIGCGGDRDREKRPVMAEIASSLSHHAIFTSDNPRSEEASSILAEMTDGLSASDDWSVVVDRSEAIETAIREHGADFVLVLGKGHEDYQEVDGTRYSLSDAEEARRAVRALREDRSIHDIPLLSGWSVERVAEEVDAELVFDGGHAVWRNLTTDSREVAPGDIFVALRGQRMDGHDFVGDAIEAGASMVIVNQDSASDIPHEATIVAVDDTGAALLRLASALIGERRARKAPFHLIGVTGSNGKTTVKEMIAALAEGEGGHVLGTRGNFNNRIGMPLSVAPLADGDRVAVLEMGANHKGEIAELVEYADPDISVLTSIGAAHTEGFGSIEGIREAKREIFGGHKLALAVLPNEEYSPRPEFWVTNSSATVVTVGVESGTLAVSRENTRGPIRIRVPAVTKTMPSLDISIPLSLPGIHQASNVGTALAAASFDTEERAFHWPSQDRIEEKLAKLQLPGGRWAEFRAGKRLIIDDAYNANPTSVRAALATIEAYDDPVWFVFGTLEEVSEDPHYVAEVHRALGEEAIAMAAKVIGVGEMAKAIAGGAGERGMEFENNQQIVDYLLTEAPERIVLLLKGSRAARLEEVREALLAEWGEG